MWLREISLHYCSARPGLVAPLQNLHTIFSCLLYCTYTFHPLSPSSLLRRREWGCRGSKSLLTFPSFLPSFLPFPLSYPLRQALFVQKISRKISLCEVLLRSATPARSCGITCRPSLNSDTIQSQIFWFSETILIHHFQIGCIWSGYRPQHLISACIIIAKRFLQ